jgi:hypothetical protein
MIRSFTTLGALALAATTSTVFAQQAKQQQPPPARGVEMVLAVEAAQAAVRTKPAPRPASIRSEPG